MTSDQDVDLFKKEFEVLRSVRHNHVVRFYGASMKPTLCMVMEYCSRGNLYDVMNDKNIEIGWKEAFQFCKETCLGLQALHNNQPSILHRDLKSLNLLVNQEWRIKLCDFGLSRFATAENLLTIKQLRGTFAYCDPAIYNGEIFTTASDIYSLGIIIWELVNRVIKRKYEQPYSEYKLAFDFDILVKASKEDLRPTIPPQCPTKVSNIIKQVLDLNKSKRPSLDQLLDYFTDLEKDLKDQPENWTISC